MIKPATLIAAAVVLLSSCCSGADVPFNPCLMEGYAESNISLLDLYTLSIASRGAVAGESPDQFANRVWNQAEALLRERANRYCKK